MQQQEPKYKQLKDYIIHHINANELRYNDQIQSENEWMKQFGLSRHTVRKALGDLVNEGWLYKQQGKGTFVASPKGSMPGRGKMVGVITTYLKDYIFPDIISGIEAVLSQEGYSILLGNTNNDVAKERMILENMLESGLSGLIIEPTKSIYPTSNKDLFEALMSQGVSILFIHAYYQNVDASYIIEDDEQAGYLVTKHLIDYGHQRIGGIFKQDDRQGHGRYAGYLKALREADITPDESFVTWYTTETLREVLAQTDERVIRDKFETITGMVCYNDQVALKITALMMELGYNLPEQLSLVSFDNSKIAKSNQVKLTTIAHPKGQLGKNAANQLIQLMNKQVTMVQEVIEPELIVRESVVAPQR